MFDALLNMGTIPLTSALGRLAGFDGEPAQEVFGKNPRYATYLSRDGKPVAVSLLEAKAWREFCESIGRPDLIAHDETPADRLTAHGPRQQLYREALREYCGARSWAELKAEHEANGIAILPVNTPDEALAHPHVAARGCLETVDDPIEGKIVRLVNPLARAGLSRQSHEPAPDLGEHSAQILGELGYSDAEIDVLRQQAVI
jgi:crotonobetainyl-CoA:carnitine CoA-transferase CaiB-like acyl-CoA transferase